MYQILWLCYGSTVIKNAKCTRKICMFQNLSHNLGQLYSASKTENYIYKIISMNYPNYITIYYFQRLDI